MNNKKAPQKKKNVACRTLYTACNLKNSIQTVRCTIRINGIQHAPIIDNNKKYNISKIEGRNDVNIKLHLKIYGRYTYKIINIS